MEESSQDEEENVTRSTAFMPSYLALHRLESSVLPLVRLELRRIYRLTASRHRKGQSSPHSRARLISITVWNE